ncbi:MAG: hypothetical protein AB1540_02970 [Bdellovibrionota bacterium]
MCALICIAWWLVASGLLFLTWNKVVTAFTKLKPAKYWQALLLVATVCVLCAPRYYSKYRGCGSVGSCAQGKHCMHGKSDCCEGHAKKGECPHSAKAKTE